MPTTAGSPNCSYDRKRLHGVALIPLQDPQRAVAELKHAKENLGLVGIFWRPNRLCGRTLPNPDYFPVYEVAADLGVPLCIHEGARTVLEQAGSDRYSEFGRHIACHPLEQMLASLNFCADGVLEKFPKLKLLTSSPVAVGCLSGWNGWTSTGSMKGRAERRSPGKAELLFQAPVLGELQGGRRAGARLHRACRRRLLDHRDGLPPQRLHRQVSGSYGG